MVTGSDRIVTRAFVRRPVLAVACAVLLSIHAPLAAPDAQAGQDAGKGRLEGTVRVGRDLGPRAASLELYQPRPNAGLRSADLQHPTMPGEDYRQVVVYLDSPELARHSREPRQATIAQVGEGFVPEVLPILINDSVEFPNRDPFYHNVFSLSRAKSFDLGRYRTGDSRLVRFDEPGIVKVFCHIHSDMSAVILVLANPFFAVPDADGRFAIDGIPAGEYKVVAWHQRARPNVRHARLVAGEATTIHIDVPIVEEADVP